MATSVRVTLAICLVLLLSPALWAGEVVVPFVGAEATFETLTDGTVSLTAPEMTTAASPGNPALPYTSQYVLLPPNADVATLCIEIRNGVEEALPGSFVVKPAPKWLTKPGDTEIEYWGEGKNIVDGRDMAIYGTNAFYPSSNAVLGDSGRLGPYQMVRVQFWPYKYNPVTGELVRLVSGDVAVTFKNKSRFLSATPNEELVAFSDRLPDFVANPAQAGAWYGRPRSNKQLRDVVAPEKTLLILTTRDIWNSCWPKIMEYVAYKQSKGWTLGLADDETWAGPGMSPGGDAAANLLRTYLQAQYTSFRYVLLIGDPNPDTGLLPMKKMSFNGTPEQNRGSDFYYADLTGNWDVNGNGYYGEEAYFPTGDRGSGIFVGWDLIPEMYVGRIPYSGGDMNQINTMLQKAMDYDNATTYGPWCQRMLLPMVPLDGDTPSYYLGENIRTNIALPCGREYYRIYDADYGLMPWREAGPNSDTATITAWLNGYGFMFEMTHGCWEYALGVINQVNCQYLPDAMPSHCFLASCECGDPTVSINVGWQLIRCGAISVVSASWDTYYAGGTTNYTNTDENGGMLYRYAYNLARVKQSCGQAWWNGQTQVPYNMYPNHIRFYLLGDPTIKAQWPLSTTVVIQTDATLRSPTRNVYFRQDLFAAGGSNPSTTNPYKWTRTSGTLPSGLTLNQNGYISGTPTTAQTKTFTLKCQANTGGAYTSKSFTMTVNP